MKCSSRLKDGKEHRYWSMVENKRVADGRVVQRHVLYLGEVNSSPQASWRRTIDLLELGPPRRRTVALFDEDRAPADGEADESILRLKIHALELHRPRPWGGGWLACHLYPWPGLDGFWAQRLEASRKGTPWALHPTRFPKASQPAPKQGPPLPAHLEAARRRIRTARAVRTGKPGPRRKLPHPPLILPNPCPTQNTPPMKTTILSTVLSACLAGLTFGAQALTADEQAFLQKAATSDQTEITLSQLALERASSPQVRDFAQAMVTDHTKSTSLLKPIAADNGVALPENPGPQSEEKRQRLEKLTGAAFDKTYLETMVADHEEVLHAFETESAKAADPKLKSFIAAVQPIVANHLQMAKAIRQNEKTSG